MSNTYMEIPLRGKYGNGKFAIVDPSQYEELSQFKWHLSRGYPERTIYEKETGHIYHLKMHHSIVGKQKEGFVVDHINGNKLDNRASNLRICTQKDNARNQGLKTTNSSGYKGVCLVKGTSRWAAYISTGDRIHAIGRFPTPEEAANAYDYYAKLYHKDFAKLNFPDTEPVKPMFKRQSSKYRGVSWCKRDEVYVAQISKGGTRFCLGAFQSEIEAALAYNKKSTELYGEKAFLNIIGGDCDNFKQA
jgi:hypothetical protein